MAEPFNFGERLSSLPKDEAIEAAYLLIRLFRYRQWIRSHASRSHREAALLHVLTKNRGKGQPDRTVQDALAIIEAYEKKVDSKFEDVGDRAADACVRSLSEFVFSLPLSDAKPDTVRAKSILADLRRDSDNLIGRGLLKR